MDGRARKKFRDSFAVSVGWLFADLLLGIAILFLAANTISPKLQPTPVVKHKTPTPTVMIDPTPTPLPRLELSFHRFKIQIDPDGLLSGNQSAIDDVKSKVKAQSFLQGRRAGLVIAYGGAPTADQIDTALEIATKVYDALKTFGKQDPIFGETSYYEPLYLFVGDRNFVTIDIYLFSKTS